jgi:alpha-aminoadipate/glutamate carrier protein LysW
MSAICPECDSPIDVDQYDVDIGDELTCSECGTLLRVSNDSPVEFEAADDDDEDDVDDEEADEKGEKDGDEDADEDGEDEVDDEDEYRDDDE